MPLLNFRSRHHSIMQSPWLTTVLRFSSLSSPCLSLSDLCKLRLHLMKPTIQSCSTASCDQNLGSQSPQESARVDQDSSTHSTCRHRFFTPRLSLGHTRRHEGLIVCRSTQLENLTLIRQYMRLPKFWPCLHAPVDNACSHTHRLTMLTSSSAMLLAMSVVSPRQHHITQLTVDPNQPEFDSLALTVDFNILLTLTFALTFDQKSKFSKGRILLSFLRRFRFWTSFLHLKL